jgi:uncharacterized protein YndB with AHSA1/START domain
VPEATKSEPIVREVHVDATPDVVFAFFTEPSKLTRWLAAEATLDPRQGGVCHQVHVSDDGTASRYQMRGEFLEVSPPGRVVFTWGFTDPAVGVPPGSSVVEVTLTGEARGTRVRLVHRDLPASELDSHEKGWTTLLDVLTTVVAGLPLEERT